MSAPSRLARSPWLALALWAAMSALAVATATLGAVPALVVGALGGAAFGVAAAAQLDGHRVRRRRRRRRRSPELVDDER